MDKQPSESFGFVLVLIVAAVLCGGYIATIWWTGAELQSQGRGYLSLEQQHRARADDWCSRQVVPDSRYVQWDVSTRLGIYPIDCGAYVRAYFQDGVLDHCSVRSVCKVW